MCQSVHKKLICVTEKLLSGVSNLNFLFYVDGRGISRPQQKAKMLKNKEKRVCG